ncbi:hypothetical protein GO986_20510 [Deinococcus sp. HMF7620]|uniref:Uncharacterized protein n=1 Tax=Deinococcus arboris TaxID=2682977 RepID=A0A7C9IF31_9DEIO|nr:hypothetical protein [Deinococcus arboris]MVN89126.1 hypothetical protein [Deinococcus arboris]
MPLYPFRFPPETHERLPAELREPLELYISEDWRDQLSESVQYVLRG